MKNIFLLFVALCLVAFPVFVKAQQNPPSGGAWGEVVDGNGNILYGNLTDLGIVQQQVDWMPSIPGISLPASYHEYQTPSGNIVVMPSATTLFFMALNPDVSGLNGASSVLGNGIGALEMLTAGFLTPAKLQSLGYVDSGTFFADVISGQTDIWSAFGGDMLNFLQSLISTSLTDQQLYTLLLLYTPDMCNQVPGGCPIGADIPTPPPPHTNDNECGTATTTVGQISVTAQKTAPNNAMVVGQDPNKVGVDLTWTVRVEPTTYTWWEKIPKYDWVCHGWHHGDGPADCRTSPSKWYNDGILRHDQVGYDCVSHTDTYPEALRWATAYADLAQSSRDWILTGDLQIRYPGAYLHNPDFSFAGFAANGSFQGNTFVWALSKPHVQVADPGWFSLDVAGATTGTAISSGRPFRLNGGSFPVYLEEVAIIQ